jgi:hypothetical protein
VNLNKQDITLILCCFGLEATQQDKEMETAAVLTMGHLVTATDANKLVMLKEMHTAATSTWDKLPAVVEKLAQEIEALEK